MTQGKAGVCGKGKARGGGGKGKESSFPRVACSSSAAAAADCCVEALETEVIADCPPKEPLRALEISSSASYSERVAEEAQSFWPALYLREAVEEAVEEQGVREGGREGAWGVNSVLLDGAAHR